MTARLGGYVQGIKNIVYYVLFPTQQSSEQIFKQTQRVSFNIKDIIQTHQENLKLRGRIENYILLENEWVKEKQENERLRAILGFSIPEHNKMRAARIVTREPGSWFQWVIIDKGRLDGLKMDVPVVFIRNEKLCVVGRIGELFEHSAKVILITNALFAMPSMLEKTKEDGLLEGQNGPLLKINYLVSKIPLGTGEIVVTSPLSSVMPEGIIIGKIKNMVQSEEESFASAIVEPEVDLANLREVIVLVPETEKIQNKQ